MPSGDITTDLLSPEIFIEPFFIDISSGEILILLPPVPSKEITALLKEISFGEILTFGILPEASGVLLVTSK